MAFSSSRVSASSSWRRRSTFPVLTNRPTAAFDAARSSRSRICRSRSEDGEGGDDSAPVGAPNPARSKSCRVQGAATADDDDDDVDEMERDTPSVASATGAAARATAASTPTSARRVASVSSVPSSSSSFFPLPGRRSRVAGGSMTSSLLFSELPLTRATVSGSSADRARRRWLSRARGFRSRGRAIGTKAIRARVSAIGPRVLAADAIPRRRRRLPVVADSPARGGKWAVVAVRSRS